MAEGGYGGRGDVEGSPPLEELSDSVPLSTRRKRGRAVRERKRIVMEGRLVEWYNMQRGKRKGMVKKGLRGEERRNDER